ncbi:hypothetical protein MMC20_001174 [Loxospora ochrophaea]|nr:hypothetical protein [Loxospora ochrophaea]
MSHHHHHNHSSHGHGDHGHDHDHDHTEGQVNEDADAAKILWKYVDFEGIRTLNESQSNSGAMIVEKTWPQRLEPEPVLTSDADEQLLMSIPFTGVVRLHEIMIRTSDDDTAPSSLKIYLNRNDLDFSSTSDLEPTQELHLSQLNDVQRIPVKRSSFGNTYCLTLFFDSNYGSGVTNIYWLAFKGEFMHLNREPVEILYEKAANPKDHAPVVGIKGMSTGLGL